jgi:extracellular elastinolytic metalloproteinase
MLVRSLFLLLIFTFLQISNSFSQRIIPEDVFLEISTRYKISAKVFETANLVSDYSSRNDTYRSIWFRQNFKSFPIHHADLFLVLNSNNKLVHSSSTFISEPELIEENITATLDELFLLKQALQPYSKVDKCDLISTNEKSKNKVEYRISGFNTKIIRELIYIQERDQLRLALALRFTDKDGLMRQLIVHRATGDIIRNQVLTVECKNDHSENSVHRTSCFSGTNAAKQELAIDGSGYHVFPFPYESPLNGPRVFLTNPADLEASPFGWHDTDGTLGAEETQTIGNNVRAYDDQDDDDFPDAFTNGGFGLQFDFPFTSAPNSSPLNNRDAAITNLFYTNNRIHDVLWHYGFDEQSGNFQLNNYSGSDGAFDAVEAQAFDGGGFNNANFGTPPDGESPRMQMYLWAFNTSNEYLSIQSPGSIAGAYQSAVATFGPNLTSAPIIAPLVLMNDGSDTPTFGCNSPLNDVSNKIVLIDRGDCNFVTKVLNAESSGAIGVIVINNTSEGPFSMGGIDPLITIPSVMISMEDGQTFKDALNQGQVIARISIENPTPYFDSSFDNGIVAHEYGHGVSNRLTGGPLNVDCLFNEEQMGEGWSDYIALMMTLTSSNFAEEARGIGNYVRGNAINGGGIRPFPYSRDMTINPVTYNFISELSIPHGLGSVWCSMLWDMTWDLIDVYGFDSDIINGNGGNNLAFQLVMDGMRFQPCAPGFIDGRDAILLADEITNNGENRCLIWNAFARRGLGALAEQGDAESAFDGVEDYSIPPNCSDSDFAFYSRSASSVCEGSVIVYTDISDPPALNRMWSFAGGIPSTSPDSIVTVTYNQAGVFAASLNIQNALGEDDFTSSVTINNTPNLFVTKGNADPINDNGFIFITPQGGIPPYATLWMQFPGVNDLTLTSLAPGTYQLTLLDAAGCGIDTTITIERINSISDLNTSEINIYPSPFDEFIQIETNSNKIIKSLNILDVSGRLIQIQGANSGSIVVQTTGFSSGIYFVKIEFTDGTMAQRRIVK